MSLRETFRRAVSLAVSDPKQFLRFCCVGLANTLVDFLLYAGLLLLGLSPYLCRAASWVGACLFSYLVNRSFTFRAGDTGFWPVARFLIVSTVSLGLGLVLLYVFKSMGCGDKLAFFLSLPFTMAANYLGYRFWAFRKLPGS